MRSWLFALSLVLIAALSARGADWPMYRADAARSGYTQEALPEDLGLRWTFRGPAPRPAWPTANRMSFDLVGQPIVSNGAVVFGTSADDRLIALDAATGNPRWQFTAEGPIRFAPAAWRDRLFVASDDGWLYALAAADGRVLWKQRGGPDDRKLLGNERLISRWPARGGPVVFDDVVCFAAGIWPTDGVYLHAIDAATGDVLWTNDHTGDLEMGQPHGGATARSGVAPQGYLVADQERLYIPTGRAVPAVFRRGDGELLYYHLQQNHTIGGTRTMLVDRYFFNGGFLFEQESGKLAARCGRGVVSVYGGGLVQSAGEELAAYAWKDLESRDRKGQAVRYRGLELAARIAFDQPAAAVAVQPALATQRLKDIYETQMRFQAVETDSQPPSINAFLAQSRPDLEKLGVEIAPFQPATAEQSVEIIVAADEAVCGGDGWVRVVDLPGRRVRWSKTIEGRALGLAVASGRLIVSTDRGLVYGFDASGQNAEMVEDRSPEVAASTGRNRSRGEKEGDRSMFSDSVFAGKQINWPKNGPVPGRGVDYAQAAKEILDKSGLSAGICVDLGCETGELALELAQRSSLMIYGVERDPAKVAAARMRLRSAGLYGTRVTVHQADPADPPYPEHLANLVVSSRSLAEGTDWVGQETLRRLQRPFGGVACVAKAGALAINRRGALEGVGRWTHQNADAANTLCSADTIAGPLSMRWFREVDFEVTDRHGQGPAPLFSQGYLVSEGVDGLIALDAYNGRTLWTYKIDNVLKDYDGVHHDVGVGDTGSNYCLSDDSVYVRTGDRCLRLELATGKKLAEFSTPGGYGNHHAWGYVGLDAGLLFGSVANEEHKVSPRYGDIHLSTESVALFAIDPATGQVRWQYKPRNAIRNNTISLAGGRAYLIDRPLAEADKIEPRANGKHRGVLEPGEHPGGRLVALDAASGKVLWTAEEDVFGTQTAVSQEHGVLLMYYQAVRHNFFRLPSEIGGRMAAHDLATGRRLWDRKATHTTRPIINGTRIIAEGGAWDLLTGEPLELRVERTYGCGQFSAGRNLVLFRSGTLGYHDLSREAGTENFGGMRPGCWFNAIAAGGLVLVPDAVAKCACSYQMHAWFALQGAERRR